ncbi:hypothetical protein PF003_g25437 [Phytophthora fragariae]|nr:hypothetical protein PF003_g25437 [Phytophthora fragariae]
MSSAESEDELVPDSDSSFDFDLTPSSSSSDSESLDEITDGGMDSNRSIDTGASVVAAINWRTALSLGTFSSRKEARIRLDTIAKARFKHKHNYQTLENAVTQFYCSSHAECGRKARIIVPKKTSGIFEVVVGGLHGVSAADQPRTGIDKIFEIECDNLLLGGASQRDA